MKQTAVEQLEEYLTISLVKDRMRLYFNEFEKAKEMEKQQQGYSVEDMKIAFKSNIKDWISFKEFIEQFQK